MQKRILILVIVIVLGASGIWTYQAYATHHPSTEDAYVGANIVRVAPRVSGRVATLSVANHQFVHKDEVLFSIDQTPFRFALEQADAELALAKREVAQAEATVASADAEVHNRQVLLDNAKSKLDRAKRLARKDYISTESVTDAEADYKSAAANLQVAQAKLEEANRELGKPGDENDRIVQAKAGLDQAQWQLDNTTVAAACAGTVSELNLQPGNVVNADKDAFVLVCSNQYWVDANYKETQLENIRPGQPATIHVDMYPDHPFHGIVENVSAATGSVFSLLPPQNANGNWVKVIQRVPVRIRIDHPDPAFPLLVGTSTTVTIDTTAKAKNQKVAENDTSTLPNTVKP
ncbi:MAG: HlyD family efflux transporter periplasmic adaptor subunit [Gammaproteobacteria bacterium]|nr:HlyD family efflux transporter periplasmic adaptor subunit [Gammaproteobacteria bacterium]